ncbi:FHA domain-containing protein [Saccharicrinis aurantiacus]|uniref:FHA domain-containing protein n=1 Tax=Saccharicrinis aurantiacus TaxID=1849719 RepID=UPI00083867CA|nr:FHA domain-containing protein [Saccharicrinis aurantiacus]
MGIIKNRNTGEEIILKSIHQFGRAKHNQTQLTCNCISRFHAVIRWEESEWQIIDNSKNGTILDNKYFHHSCKTLSIGNIIRFANDKSIIWEIIDDKPPSSYLLSTKIPNCIFELNSLNMLPNNKTPLVSFFKTNTYKWNADTGHETIELKNGNKYIFGNNEWLFIENEIIEYTIDFCNIIDQSYFLFTISDDEEDVDVKIIINDLHLELGVKVYNHLLLELVRQKLIDRNSGLDQRNQGWISVSKMENFLSKELLIDIDDYYLNIQVHRLRKKIMEIKPYGYLFSNIIERKKGKLRFTHPHFKIIRSNSLNIAKQKQPVLEIY